MKNKAMKRKLEGRKCIDVSGAKRIGPYYVLAEATEGVDYCDAKREAWIWSIGQAQIDLSFTIGNVVHLIPKNTIIASLSADLYGRDNVDCLWLR